MRFRFTPNDNGQGLDSRSEAAQDPKLHKRYFAGYTGTAKNLFGKKTLSDFGDVGMRWGCTNCTNEFFRCFEMHERHDCHDCDCERQYSDLQLEKWVRGSGWRKWVGKVGGKVGRGSGEIGRASCRERV